MVQVLDRVPLPPARVARALVVGFVCFGPRPATANEQADGTGGAADTDPPGASKGHEGRLRFAEHLAAVGDPYRAITVLKEAAFQAHDPVRARRLRERIAALYERARRWPAAALEWERIAEGEPSPDKARAPLVRAATAWIHADRCAEALVTLLRLSVPGPDALAPDADLVPRIRFGEAVCEARLGRFEAGLGAAQTIPEGHDLAHDAADYVATLQHNLPLPTKSPGVAGALSIVPGLGHLYVGDSGTAVTALLWNGLFGLAAYEAYSNELYFTAGLLSVLELLWYGGSIYGAVNLAHRHNQSQRDQLADHVLHEYGGRFPYGGRRSPAVGVDAGGDF